MIGKMKQMFNNSAALWIVTLALVLPFAYGCDDDGSASISGDELAAVLGGTPDIEGDNPVVPDAPNGGAEGGVDGGGVDGGLGGDDANVNPEPATILLLGSGVAALGYYRNRKRS